MTVKVLSPELTPVAIPVQDVLPWAILGGLVALLAIYFIGAEQGADIGFPRDVHP